jgi:glycosyltransferase involved in cell wall biosynthesis
MKKQFYSLIFAQNYVTYHSSLYREFFKKSKRRTIVIYEDAVGHENRYEERWKSNIKWGIDLKKGYKSILLNNFSKNPNSQNFFSRINWQIPFVIYKVRPKFILFQGYSDLSSWLILIFSVILRVKNLAWKGERIIRKDEKIFFFKKFILKYFFFNFCNIIYYSCNGNLEYLQLFNIDKAKLKPMNCSVDNYYFKEKYNLLKNKKTVLKKKININTSYFTILVVSNFEKRKNIDLLLSILPFIEGKKIQIVLVGSGIDYYNIIKKVYRFRNQLKIFGFTDISKISEFYTIADVFCLLSSYDPSPKTLNEALNFYLPCIISSNIGTARDLIKSNRNGFVISTYSKFKLINAINRILCNKKINDSTKHCNLSLLDKYSPKQNADAIF